MQYTLLFVYIPPETAVHTILCLLPPETAVHTILCLLPPETAVHTILCLLPPETAVHTILCLLPPETAVHIILWKLISYPLFQHMTLPLKFAISSLLPLLPTTPPPSLPTGFRAIKLLNKLRPKRTSIE